MIWNGVPRRFQAMTGYQATASDAILRDCLSFHEPATTLLEMGSPLGHGFSEDRIFRSFEELL